MSDPLRPMTPGEIPDRTLQLDRLQILHFAEIVARPAFVCAASSTIGSSWAFRHGFPIDLAGYSLAVCGFTARLSPIDPFDLSFFHYDQRIREEGFDIEWRMQAAGTTQQQPLAPQPAAPDTASLTPHYLEIAHE